MTPLDFLSRSEEALFAGSEPLGAASPPPSAAALAALDAAHRRIEDLEGALQHSSQTLSALQTVLGDIHASHGWRLLTFYYRLRERLLPQGSWRRAGLIRLFHLGERLWRALTPRREAAPQMMTARSYPAWIARHEPGSDELARQREERFRDEPLVSIVVPVGHMPPAHLLAMLESVLAQTYARWQLCLAAVSSSPPLRRLLEEVTARDGRICVRFLAESVSKADLLAAACEPASGPYLALLEPGDTLAPFALFEVVRALNEQPQADFLYSDEDHLGGTGQRERPLFKPDWSPDTLTGCNYIGHLVVLRRHLLEKCGGFRPGFEGAEDYDLVLRATEQAGRIVHLPRVLYHRRMSSASGTDGSRRLAALELSCRAIEEHLQRTAVSGSVLPGPTPGTYQVVRDLPEQPLVSIIIPSHDQHEVLARCIDSISRSSYRSFEILIAENHSKEPETFAYYKQLADRPEVRLLTWDRPFNYAAVNNWAASQARGEVLLLLNNDTEVRNADWLERMLEHALRPEVGAVGSKLYYPDGSIQHGGVILGVRGVAEHAHRYWPGASSGYAHRLSVVQELSAVTGACLMMRRSVFKQVGGFDERYVIACNDIDLCLRVRRHGYRVLWTPFAELFHHEQKTRGADDTPAKQARHAAENRLFLTTWKDVLDAGDPFYNPNLTLDAEDFSLRT
jgi:GT2 family glycosyltransferase